MSNNLVPLDNTRAGLAAPSKMQARMAAGDRVTADNFTAGAQGGFHVLSIRGGKFHMRFGKDNEVTITDPSSGAAVGFLDIVLVNASKNLAKTYYKAAYAQGNDGAPDCWSLDSIRPDPSVQNKVNPTCQDCPMNAFGSRVTPDGRPAKKCADSRRVAITLPAELSKPDPTPVLLRVPQSSIRTLRDYVDLLARNGYEPGGCVTRVTFDGAASYPKLMFHFVGPLTDQEFETVDQFKDGPNIKAMLQGSDLANASPINTNAPLTQLTRQAPLTIDNVGGFGPGMLQPVHAQGEQVTPGMLKQLDPSTGLNEPGRELPAPQPTIIDLPDGRQFNTATGQYVEKAKAEPQVDPAVVALPDGKFFHPVKGTYVESQFVGAREATATMVPVPAEPKKRAPRAPKPQPEPTPEPEAKLPAPNGNGDVVKPTVIAASPKLEQLLSGLAPKKEGK